jgi:hypothetical protein
VVKQLYDQTASCEGKVRFGSAKIAMMVIKRRDKSRNRGQSVTYFCKYCGGYHLGSPAQRPSLKKSLLTDKEDDACDEFA